ncbi:DNA-directed RNA polymerase core subunit rpc40 [Nowakowskiella sp. JEL0078]|nr:DNA-directed RNA polymerase core subunit rpc40 [Nowakowskiella sp. JEL0078]
MAIETVYMYLNTGIMHDEVMSHRLGLIPIKVDPRKFQFKAPSKELAGPECDISHTDRNTIVFNLNIKCTKNLKALPNSVHPNDKYINSSVTSGMLEWVPNGAQGDVFKDDPIRVVNTNILITKLRPDQEINAELHCQKGIGREHAKWSPVATASYRLLPDIQILEPITGTDAEKFQTLFPDGVVKLVKNSKGILVAKIDNPRKDTMSREVLRHKEFEKKVRLTRIRDHFIFNIESTGVLPANVLFEEACKKLVEKCRLVKHAAQNARTTVAQYNQ